MTSRSSLGSLVAFTALALAGCAEGMNDEAALEEEAPATAVGDACIDDSGPCAVSGSVELGAGEGGINPALPSRYPFWALQLNLCNSGFAGCYENGTSIPEGSTVIRNTAPDVVTLNEICSGDVQTLHATLASVYSSGTVIWAFKAAGDKRSGGPYKCKNGQDYGIGVVMHIPAPYNGYTVSSGLYPMQDGGSNEQRAWLCVSATGNYLACTTHLATVGSVALNQCNHLTRTVIPQVQAAGGGALPTLLGADLNLRYGGSPDAQACVPGGFYRKGDGSVQHFIASSNLSFVSTQKIGMSHTDHPAWFMKMTAP